MESDFSVSFRGLTGSLKLVVEGYQFPNVEYDWWDANWLVVRGHAALDGRSWDFRDACLTTFELERLASWLDGVANGNDVPMSCAFMEPNLEFKLVANRNFHVLLSLGALPPWADTSTGVVVFEVTIDHELANLAADLRKILAQFTARKRGAASAAQHAT